MLKLRIQYILFGKPKSMTVIHITLQYFTLLKDMFVCFFFFIILVGGSSRDVLLSGTVLGVVMAWLTYFIAL